MKFKYVSTSVVILISLSSCVPTPLPAPALSTVMMVEVTSPSLPPTPIPSETPVPTSTATNTLTPPPICVIEDFEGVRRGIWWSPDVDVFSYQETSERASSSNQSFRVNYTKSDTQQFIAFEPEEGSCNFQTGNNFHVWVYGEVTLLLKLEDRSGKEVDISEQEATTSDNWTLLIFNYAGAAAQIDVSNVKNIKFFPIPGNVSAKGTFFLDDLSLYP